MPSRAREPILIAFVAPARVRRAGPVHLHAPRKHGAWLRALVLGLAAGLAFVLIVAASHHHASRLETHECGICAVLMDELPGAGGLPAPAPAVLACAYLLAIPVVYLCLYRWPRLMPPICGPPHVFLATPGRFAVPYSCAANGALHR